MAVRHEPSPLLYVQFCLSEEVLQDLVVCINVALVADQIVPPYPQCMYHGCKLKVMGWVVLFVLSQLS